MEARGRLVVLAWVLSAVVVKSLIGVTRFPQGRPVLALRAADENEVEIFVPLENAEQEVASTTPSAVSEGDEFKRLRVLTYMGVSLLPILALIPFMASRDFVPVDPSAYS